jgi:antitoxin component YwqK of YwqJK toxin-antitoxin module
MKKLLFLFLVMLGGNLSAATFFDQLIAINSSWENFALSAPRGEAKSFPGEQEYIRAHLSAVETVLRAVDVSVLSESQKAARLRNLDILHGYILAGSFPQNFYRSSRTPVFIDENGTHCAVGFLMQQSGYEKMAKRISAADNYVFVKNIGDPELASWQENSGLSLSELALIQPSYMAPPTAFEQQPACTTVYFSNDQNYNYFSKGGNRNPGAESGKDVWYSGQCENGVLHGMWVQYHKPGILWIEGQFVNGKKAGTWFHYLENKEKWVSEKENWVNGRQHGLYERFDNQGKLSMQGNYVNGEKEGTWRTWQGGILTQEIIYKNGRENGDWLQYYYYYENGKAVDGKLAIHAVYSDGIMQSYQLYGTDGSLTEEKRLISGSRYLTTHYAGGMAVRMKGEEVYSTRIDSSENIMYPNLPKTYTKVGTYEKTGIWKVFMPMSHYMLLSPYDSAHFYLRRDSVYTTVLYKRENDVLRIDSTVYEMQKPYSTYYYATDQASRATQSWRTENGSLVKYTETDKYGDRFYDFEFRNGKLMNGIKFTATGQYEQTWNISTEGNVETLHYQRFDEQGRLLMKGTMLDTSTRHGAWEFYDTTGAVISTGNYQNDLREGEWAEYQPGGLKAVGKYHLDSPVGLWIFYTADGKVHHRKSYKQ